MTSHYLAFLDGRWQRLRQLPYRKLAAPTEQEVKWLIAGWDEYCIDEHKRMWRRPHANQQGRRKGWKHIRAIEKNEGYRGFNFWRDGKRYYFSVRQLRGLLQRNPTYKQGVQAT